ncbi:MAG TPA: response regulator [Candidatus Acidoferrum sp.]|nr:response regulator [Candidatus Acidoferrum sp.]
MASNKSVIAIIEDDEGFREALAGMLTSFGYEPVEFSGAREFLESSERGRVCCVISDIQMPGMSGLELQKIISAEERPIPTLLITAMPSDDGRKRALEAGAFCYLAKPFADEDLLGCIERALRSPHSSESALS